MAMDKIGNNRQNLTQWTKLETMDKMAKNAQFEQNWTKLTKIDIMHEWNAYSV